MYLLFFLLQFVHFLQILKIPAGQIRSAQGQYRTNLAMDFKIFNLSL